jgi:hypothetical protein
MVLPNLQLRLGDFVHGSTTLLLWFVAWITSEKMLVYLCFTLAFPSVVGIVRCYACVGIGTVDVVWMLDIFMKVRRWAWGLRARSSRFMNLPVVAMHCLVILVYVVENMLEVIAKKFLYERMYKIYKVFVFLRVTFLLIPIPFCL